MYTEGANHQQAGLGGGIEYISPAREQYERLLAKARDAEKLVEDMRGDDLDERAAYVLDSSMRGGQVEDAAALAVATLSEPGQQPEVARRAASDVPVGDLQDALTSAEERGDTRVDEVVDELIDSIRTEAAGNYCSVWIDRYVKADLSGPLRISPAAFKRGALPAEVADEVVVSLVEKAERANPGATRSDLFNDIAKLPVKLSNDAAIALFRQGSYDFVLNNAHMFPQMKIDSLSA